jgi:hypothetical protein
MNPSIPKSTSSSEQLGFLGKRPWLFVIAAFMLLFGAWTALFILAYQNQPQAIPVHHR